MTTFIGIFFFLVVVGLVSSVPFDRLILWLYKKRRIITEKMITINRPMQFTWAPLIFVLSYVLAFGKGYLALYLEARFFNSEALRVLTVMVVLICHNWSVFLALKNRRQFIWVLWGIYAFISPWMILVYPVGYILFSLLFNSFKIGLILNIVCTLFVFGFSSVSSIYLGANFFIFIIVFLSFSIDIFHHLESRKWSIYNCFQTRRL